jgi:quercetin dioxygenase-like cupin family protein
MKSKWVCALLVAVLATGVYAGNVLATPSSGVTTSILAKSRFEDFDVNAHTIPARLWRARIKTHGLSDVYVVDNKIAQGGTTGWHSHPGPSLILVVAGTVTNYTGDDRTCTGRAYRAGSGFIDPGGNDVHMLRNEGSVQAETIAVQLLPKDADRKIDKPDPGNCQF